MQLTKQAALDWWNTLPIQDLQNGIGWANLTIKYYPEKTDCYGLTGEEIKFIYYKEHLNDTRRS